MSADRSRQLLGEFLIAKGVISSDQLRIALVEQRRSGERLGRLLLRLGFCTEATMNEALGENLSEQSVDLSRSVFDEAALKLVPQDTARRLRTFPLAYDPQRRSLVLAMSDPKNIVALDQVRAQVGREIELQPVLAGESEIIRCIDQSYGFELSIDGILNEIETGEIDDRSLHAGLDGYSHPLVRLIDALLADAVRRDASDIHFEPEQGFLRIRYRIDGVLRQIRSLHKLCWTPMVVRLKVMSGMNIAEMRAPQDGRISLTLSGRDIDFRVASQPTVHGENFVLRILDRHRGVVPLERLNLHADDLHQLRRMLARPNGIILVTGPTGSGKTTTLYSILNQINTEGVNIMTLEDPVEYPMPRIRQSSLNEAARMDFASGIRSMMRQDPDVILVGEIRDSDTAGMAFRAAMTGHQVYSTLHANSAIGAIPRLLDIGVSAEIMAGNLIGIVAQRLVRRLCGKCREPYVADAHECRLLAVAPGAPPPLIHRATGCEECGLQGYRGRVAVMELLKIDADLDELIACRATLREFRNAALAKGFRSLADDAVRRVLEGQTSIDEAVRVVDLSDRFN
jgi:type II secretory ATPase GspE/PulE/Tfp pilus assembly ATPase PilB-like protein